VIFSANKSILFLCAILLVTVLSFLPVLGHSIDTWDDESHITQYDPVRQLSWANVKTIFQDNVCNTYIPLTSTTFAVEHHFFGFSPFVYHLNNLLLHLANVFLVFFLARRLGFSDAAGLIASLIFAVHPMHVESVAWATERKDVLYSFFYLLALISYIRYVDSKAWVFLVFSVALTALSMLSKAMALSLPLVLFLIDWYRGRKTQLVSFLDKIPFFLVVVPLAWITYSMNVRVPSVEPLSAALTWIWTFVFYLRKFAFPYPLIPLYMLPKPVQVTHVQYLFSSGLFFLMGYGVWRYQKNRVIVFAFFYYVLSVFFLMRVDDVVDVNIVADRFMYLPSIGICFLLGWLFELLVGRMREKSVFAGRVSLGAAVVFFVVMAGMTFFQTKVWKDDLSMWSHVLKFQQQSDMAHVGLGQYAYESGEADKAFDHYRKALESNPLNAKANNNVAELLYQQGFKDEAHQLFEAAVRIKPDYAEALNNYAVSLMERGQIDAALFNIREAIRNKPRFDLFQLSLGDIYLKSNDLAGAEEQYEKVLKLKPKNSQALNRLGVVFLQRGEFAKAVQYFRKAYRYDPANVNIQRNLDIATGQMNGLMRRGQPSPSPFGSLSGSGLEGAFDQLRKEQ